MRTFLVWVSALVAALAFAAVVWFMLDSYRDRGGVRLRLRERVGLRTTSLDTLTHGSGEKAVRWSADYADEVLEAAGGRATRVRRTWMSVEDGASGAPRPTPLQESALLSASGALDEKTGKPWTLVPVAFPDAFDGVLPPTPVNHSAEWACPATAASAIAAFLSRGEVHGARLDAKLEPEMDRDGVRCHRIRAVVRATLDRGRALEAHGDLFLSVQDGVILDADWLGSIESADGATRVAFTRQRRLRK